MSRITFDIESDNKDELAQLFDENHFGRTFAGGMRQLVMIAIAHPEILALTPNSDVATADQRMMSRIDELEDTLDEKFEQLNNKFSGDKQSVDITHQLITELQGDVRDLFDEVKNGEHSSLDQASVDHLSDTLTRNLKVLLFDMMMSGQQPMAPGRYASNRTGDLPQ